jgi:hypothetical protein
MNVRRMLYYGLISPLWHMESLYGDRLRRHSLDEYLPFKKGCKVHGSVKIMGTMLR